PGLGRLEVDAAPEPRDAAGEPPRLREIEVWQHRGRALDEGEAVGAFLSAHLAIRARLVRLPPPQRPAGSPDWVAGPAETALSDGYPLLVLSQASLDDLNRRLPRPLPVNRFRPNLVVQGAEPYAEDLWRRVRIGDVELAIVKPCSRCAITTTDQQTAER